MDTAGEKSGEREGSEGSSTVFGKRVPVTVPVRTRRVPFIRSLSSGFGPLSPLHIGSPTPTPPREGVSSPEPGHEILLLLGVNKHEQYGDSSGH